MDQKEALEIAKSYLDLLDKNHYPVNEAWLFGSFAKGDHHKDSDIDIAVVLKDVEPDFDTGVQLMKLSSDIDTRIEPHPFDEKDFNSSHMLPDGIIKTGMKIT